MLGAPQYEEGSRSEEEQTQVGYWVNRHVAREREHGNREPRLRAKKLLPSSEHENIVRWTRSHSNAPATKRFGELTFARDCAV